MLALLSPMLLVLPSIFAGYQQTQTRTIVKSSSIISTTKTEVVVNKFRGAGAAEGSKTATIDSAIVYNSLFLWNSFPSVFTNNSKEEMIELKLPDDVHKVQLIVKDADKPFLVGHGLIAYFWGSNRLPENWQECANYIPSNGQKSISYCNITGMDRCAAPISDYPHLAPFVFTSRTGQQLTQLAWMCPKGRACCAFECCEIADGEPFPKTIIISIVGLFAFLITTAVFIGIADRRRQAYALTTASSSTTGQSNGVNIRYASAPYQNIAGQGS